MLFFGYYSNFIILYQKKTVKNAILRVYSDMPEQALTRGAVGNKLDFEHLSHPSGEPCERIDCGTARAVFDAADVGLPDARFFGKLLLCHLAFQTCADDGADCLILRA